MPNPDQLRALNTQIAPAAVASEAATGLPACLFAGICIEETGYLAAMPQDSNNPFGVKAYLGCYGRVLSYTHEWFTDAEVAHFRSLGQGRTAALEPKKAGIVMNGRKYYIVQDYFAMFATLAVAFQFEAQMLLKGATYKAAAQQYLHDHDLSALIRAIAPHYSTDATYAAQLEKIATQPAVTAAIAAVKTAVAGY